MLSSFWQKTALAAWQATTIEESDDKVTGCFFGEKNRPKCSPNRAILPNLRTS
jgi:hypothetical protein